MPLFRQKPEQVEAVYFDGTNPDEVAALVGNMPLEDHRWYVRDRAGRVQALPNDAFRERYQAECYPGIR